jgi:hypothetical protein
MINPSELVSKTSHLHLKKSQSNRLALFYSINHLVQTTDCKLDRLYAAVSGHIDKVLTMPKSSSCSKVTLNPHNRCKCFNTS